MAQRKLAAILAADVAGFTALMERDEVGTLERLKATFAGVFEPRVALHGGRVVKFMGDGALVEFVSVVAAVRCALELQAHMAESEADEAHDQRLRFRIGVNLGDVIIEGDDIFGDGVNVAARLQTLAAPGGVAMSRTVREHVAGKIEIEFDDLGEHKVKNKRHPVHVFAYGGSSVEASRKDDRIAICVLPFLNKSGDPEQEYLADGVTEDVITDLTKVSALQVASRHAAFAYKNKDAEIGHVCRQLGCAYVLEGTVRKAGQRVRITAQLIDGRTDTHLWAERYDRDLDDIFALQAELAAAIAAALKARILPDEQKALETKATANAEAYKLFLMARQYSVMGSERHDPIVARLCQRAVELDPNYARAWALLAMTQTKMRYRDASDDDGAVAAERAVALDPGLADAHAAHARVLANEMRYDEAVAAHERALAIDPESYEANLLAGRTYTAMKRHADAVRCFEKATTLVETDYVAAAMLVQNYEALHDSENVERACRRSLERIERIIAAEPDHGNALGHGIGALAILGETDRARDWAERAVLLDPDNRTLIYNLSCAMARLGEQERALDYLERALKQAQPQAVVWAQADTDLDPIRDSPRYAEIMAAAEKRVGLSAR